MKKNVKILRKKEWAISLIILFFYMSAIIFFAENPSDKIGNRLTSQGYDTENIEFVFLQDGDGNEKIYKSTEPIYYEGHYVQQWSVQFITFSPGSFVEYCHVTPYPPFPKMVSLTIKFTQGEIEEIAEWANEKEIEDYIKEKAIKR